MEVKLIVAHGKHAGKEVPVPGPKFFIGRAEDCQLRPSSDLISRHHCVILVDEGFVAVRDFGSKNGTFVNDERVHSETELKSGDHLKVGQLEFEVRLVVPVGGKKKPKVKSVEEAAARTAQVAARPARDDDDAVADWLGDAKPATVGETTTMDGTLANAKAKTGSEEPEKTTPDAEAEAPKKEAAKPQEPAKPAPVMPGLSKTRKPEAASSRDAAADMLRNMFNRR